MASLDRMISSSRRAVERASRRPAARRARGGGAAISSRSARSPRASWARRSRSCCAITDRRPGACSPRREAAGVGRAGGAPATRCRRASSHTWLPVLHKGVLIDPYQLYESRLGGADGVVLIADAFDGDDDDFAEMQIVAAQLGLDVVVEVADEEELELALELLDPDSFLIQNLARRREGPRVRAHLLAARGGAGREGGAVGGRHPPPRPGARARDGRRRRRHPGRLGARARHRARPSTILRGDSRG